MDEVSSINDVTEQSVAYRDEVIPVMRSLREDIDQLEALVDAQYWPIPTYGDMLFGME